MQKKWQQTSIRLTLNEILFNIVQLVDLLVVKVIINKPEQVDHYAAALTLSGLAYLIVRQIYVHIPPKISTLFKHNRAALKKLIQKSTLVAALSVLIVFALISIFSKPLLSVFGPGYSSAWPILIIISFGGFVLAFVLPTTQIFLYAGYEKWTLISYGIEITILLAAAIPLTIYLGLLGAAISVPISLLFRLLFLRAVARKKLKMKTMPF